MKMDTGRGAGEERGAQRSLGGHFFFFFLGMSKHSSAGRFFCNGVWLQSNKKEKGCGWDGRDRSEQFRFQELLSLLLLL